MFQKKNNPDAKIVVHCDKVELSLLASLANFDLLSSQFHDLVSYWKATYGLVSRAKKCRSATGRLVFWELELNNQDIRITLKDCPALHIHDTTGKPLREESDWLQHPFPSREQLYEHYTSISFDYMGTLRITCKDKTDPYKYARYIWKILLDLEQWGVEHKTRLLEIAMDIYDKKLADRLRETARLTGHKSPLDLGHWAAGSTSDGASTDGNNEYEHFRGFLRDRTRQLYLYSRSANGGFYRIELKLGQVYLHRYYGTKAFYKDLERSGGRCRANPSFYLDSDRPHSKFHSPTLPLLDAMPALIQRHLMFEWLDVEKLITEHPRLATVDLTKRSIRGQRYYLARARIPTKTYVKRLPFPDFTSITPADIEARELETNDLNKCEIDEVENKKETETIDAYTPKGIITPCPAPFFSKPPSIVAFDKVPKSRSP